MCLIQGATAVHAQDHSSRVLVTPDWLDNQIATNSKLRILDLPLRKTNYQTGHIPGAVFLDWRSDIISSDNPDLYQVPSKAAMEKLLGRLGVTSDTTIVVTDNMQNRSAVRMYFTLKYFGHDDVRILNGGTKAWVAADKQLTSDVPTIESTKYEIKTLNKKYVVKLEAVQNAIDDAGCQLIDVRPNDQFSGEVPGKVFHTNKPHARLGHVPSAECIPWTANLNDDGTFKTIDQLKQLYQSQGIDTEGKIIAYCNEGLHAVMPWFVIHELLGNKQITVYENSMGEWANRDDTPLKKADE